MTEIVFKKESYAIVGACFEVHNYLHATGFELGLLVNFGHYPKLEYERIARTQQIKTRTDFSDVSL